MYACIVIGVLSAAFGAILDGLILLGLAFAVRKMSRVASLVAAVLYVGAQVHGLIVGRLPGVIAVIACGLLISAVRASFAYHRFRKQSVAGEPSQAG
jgi:uncharacterized membrane protein YedE/YeeE